MKILINATHKCDFHKLCQNLKKGGMILEKIFGDMRVIIGEIDDDKLEKFKKFEGVAKITKNEE